MVQTDDCKRGSPRSRRLGNVDKRQGGGGKSPPCLSMTTESRTREFPLDTPSLLNLVKTSETRVKGLGPEQ